MVERAITQGGLRSLLALLLLAAGLLAPAPAHADGAASAWFEKEQGKVRLVAAAPAVGNTSDVRLGLEFRLAPHWKV